MRQLVWFTALMAACSSSGEERGDDREASSPISMVTDPISMVTDPSSDGPWGQGRRKLTVEKGPRGTKISLPGAFATAAAARRWDDGRIEVECFDEPAAAAAFLREALPSRAAAKPQGAP